MINVVDDFYLYHELYKKLYPYQREGVKWLWHLFQKKKGGVLGDDMGLGKTIQIIAFLSGMFDMDAIKYVLVVMPVSLLPNWEKEFQKWTPGLSIYCFHGSSKRERERVLSKTQNRGGVMLTSYGMLANNVDLLKLNNGREFVWDYVILDEAHKIKNPTKTTKAAHSIPARNRIALTGTPIQNNLRELWSLYDFVQQGTLLGSLPTFKMQYETPITRSREKDATAGERRLGTEIADSLFKLIQPYFLRRTKQEVLSQKVENISSTCTKEEKQMREFHISRKNDFIIWLYLSAKQMEIYKDFLELDSVKDVLMTKRSPLVELTVLKKLCDHPRLLSKRACKHLGLDGDIPEDAEEEIDDGSASAVSIENVTDEELVEESGKLWFLLSLLSNLRETGHRTLVFSLSRKMLDIIHRILVNRNWKVMRIDGTVSKIEDRQKRIQIFQQDLSIPVFLLTTQVGGVGFTLTGADRVVIYDPSWNPATDAQAVDRVYRIGQDKNVVIYRLITCSTVEEKIYRRQIFKDSITQQATGGNKNPYRYFTRQELRDLFTLENPHHSATQVQLEEMHTSQRKSDTNLDEHIAFLYSLNIFGISDHDLMFSGEQTDDGLVLPDEAVNDHYIKQRVETAQQLLTVESEITSEDNLKANTYARSYTISMKPVKSNTVKDLYKPPTFPDIVDLNQINTSLQHMSFHGDSVNISDASCTIYNNRDNCVADSKSENVKNGSTSSKENVDEAAIIIDEDNNQKNVDEAAIIIDEDNNQENVDEATVIVDKENNQGNQILSLPPVIVMETSMAKRPRRSILYVAESENEETEDSDASNEMFVLDSEESDRSDSPSCNQNEYRNAQIRRTDYHEKEEQRFLPATSTPIRNKFSAMTEEVTPIGSQHQETKSLRDCDIIDTKEAPAANLYADCIDETEYLKGNHHLPTDSTPLKELPATTRRITPLKVPKLQALQPKNSSFQRALLQSKELDPVTPDFTCSAKTINNSLANNSNTPLPLSTTKSEKLQHDPLKSKTILKIPETMLLNTSKCEKFWKDISMSQGPYATDENNCSTLSTKSSNETDHDKSDYSPVRGVRKPCRRIIDLSDDSIY